MRDVDNKTACIKDLKEEIQYGLYNFADRWKTEEFLLKRRGMPQWPLDVQDECKVKLSMKNYS